MDTAQSHLSCYCSCQQVVLLHNLPSSFFSFVKKCHLCRLGKHIMLTFALLGCVEALDPEEEAMRAAGDFTVSLD